MGHKKINFFGKYVVLNKRISCRLAMLVVEWVEPKRADDPDEFRRVSADELTSWKIG